MANAWGKSWGSAFGVAFGFTATPSPDTTVVSLGGGNGESDDDHLLRHIQKQNHTLLTMISALAASGAFECL